MGDRRCVTAAFVGRDGSIDWLCWPAFDSDAVSPRCSARRPWPLADRAYAEIARSSRRYWDNTLILETTFESAGGKIR